MKFSRLSLLLLLLTLNACQTPQANDPTEKTPASYEDMVELFKDWRTFEKPPLLNNAPDYRASTFENRWADFKSIQNSLLAMDTTGWSIPEQVDYHIVWAEMNGYDFNHNILRPWQRDPAYYKVIWMERSDVPAHEGPTNHGTVEVWTYEFPLNAEQRELFLNGIQSIPAFNDQAKINLTGNAKDLWIAGIRDIKTQSVDLTALKSLDGVSSDLELLKVIDDAITSTNELVVWLENQSASKTGPSGIGKENYTWYQQNVHLVPLTWDDEVMILKRELARAWSALKLEEHRNRHLPELVAANS
ncbi:MAG TPA: hypothetical protein VIN11_04400, partial [Roseivirga sp.]